VLLTTPKHGLPAQKLPGTDGSVVVVVVRFNGRWEGVVSVSTLDWQSLERSLDAIMLSSAMQTLAGDVCVSGWADFSYS